MDKVLILVWILLGSVLIIENIVSGMIWYLFLSTNANTGMLSFVSILIWIIIWYWVRWYMNNKSSNDYDNDEYDF